MLPVVALVGRPNVGKSTLFNRLTRTRDALVADFPGLTRDRKYGSVDYEGLEFIVVDTGGIDGSEEGIELEMAEQSLRAIDEADIVLFMVDARTGATKGPGAYQLRWDGKDDKGAMVPKGAYQLVIEAAREHGGRQLVKQKFNWDGSAITLTVAAGNEIGEVQLNRKAP